MVEPESGLVRLLPEEEVPSFASYFVYPAELKNSARVHVFRDFLLTKARNWSY
jgi:DNA-binding transcriptional LysR family regulator